MNWIISYPRSGNTMTRYLFELMTGKPTNGICPGAEINPRDNLQNPLIHPCTDDPGSPGSNYCLHKAHDFRRVDEYNDFVLFILRDPVEAVIRHNEKKRGIRIDQMKRYLTDWFGLLSHYDIHQGPKLLLYYDQVQKIAAKESRQLYRGAESRGPDWHKAKLWTGEYERLVHWMQHTFPSLYSKYL